VIAQGSGENGKTTVLSAVIQALGDYGAPCSPKLIASAKDEHSTERADLRGQRLLVAEELTENRALNVTAIKQVRRHPRPCGATSRARR
jgi:putative DNA primase/helicase